MIIMIIHIITISIALPYFLLSFFLHFCYHQLTDLDCSSDKYAEVDVHWKETVEEFVQALLKPQSNGITPRAD